MMIPTEQDFIFDLGSVTEDALADSVVPSTPASEEPATE